MNYKTCTVLEDENTSNDVFANAYNSEQPTSPNYMLVGFFTPAELTSTNTQIEAFNPNTETWSLVQSESSLYVVSIWPNRYIALSTDFTKSVKGLRVRLKLNANEASERDFFLKYDVL